MNYYEIYEVRFYEIHEPENEMIWPGAIRAENARAALDDALEHIRQFPWAYQVEGPEGPLKLALRAVNVEDATDVSDGIAHLPGSGGVEDDGTVESLLTLPRCIAAIQRIATGEPAAEVIHGLGESDGGWVYEALSRHLELSIHEESRTRVRIAARALIDEVMAMGAPKQD